MKNKKKCAGTANLAELARIKADQANEEKKAEAARHKAEEKERLFKTTRDEIEKQIERYADQGRYDYKHTLSNALLTNFEVRGAIQKHFTESGFVVDMDPDPEQDCDYIVISWEHPED